MGSANPVLVVLATLCLILLGLALNFFTAFFPLFLWILWRPDHSWYYLLPVLIVQFLHLRYLWIDKRHLASYRFLTSRTFASVDPSPPVFTSLLSTRPLTFCDSFNDMLLCIALRRILLPVVMFVVKTDSIKDKEDTMYLSLDKVSSPSDDLSAFLSSFPRSIRRRYKKVVQQTFAQAGIRVVTVPVETGLDLQEVVPLIWAHQKRLVATTAKLVEDFVKRFLVMTVVPDGVLDLFYQDDRLMAVQMGVLQGATYHWFMYFSHDQARQSGIWFYGTLLSIKRAKLLEGQGAVYVNAHIHHAQTKQNAGYDVASCEDYTLLDQLYPWAWARSLPEDALCVSLLGPDGSTAASDK
jgi:hypothetical protein